MQGHHSDIDALRDHLTARVAAAGLDHLIEIRMTDGRPDAVLEEGTAEFALRLAGRYEDAEEVASLAAGRDWTGYIDRVIDAFRAPG